MKRTWQVRNTKQLVGTRAVCLEECIVKKMPEGFSKTKPVFHPDSLVRGLRINMKVHFTSESSSPEINQLLSLPPFYQTCSNLLNMGTSACRARERETKIGKIKKHTCEMPPCRSTPTIFTLAYTKWQLTPDETSSRMLSASCLELSVCVCVLSLKYVKPLYF